MTHETDDRTYFLKGSPTYQKKLLWFEFAPGPIHYLIHAERLSELKVVSFAYEPIVELFEVELHYKGNSISFSMHFFDQSLFLSSSNTVPGNVFSELAEHLDNFKKVPRRMVREWQKKYRCNNSMNWYKEGLDQ